MTSYIQKTVIRLAALALAAALVAPAAFAQVGARPEKAPKNMKVTNANVETLSSYDLSDMSTAWWTDLAAHLDRRLHDSTANLEKTMAAFIFLGTFYPDRVDFHGSTTELYNEYRFNRDRNMRIMALASLYAIGDDSAMRMIGYHRGPYLTFAAWESDELVRRLTAAAVARYYTEGGVEVGAPTRAR